MLPVHDRKISRTQSDPPLIGFCPFFGYNNRMQIKQRKLSMNSIPQNLVYREVVHSLNTLVVQNISQVGFAYIGNANVSLTDFGFKLFPGQSFIAELAYSDNLYAVGDSGVQVSILELDRA